MREESAWDEKDEQEEATDRVRWRITVSKRIGGSERERERRRRIKRDDENDVSYDVDDDGGGGGGDDWLGRESSILRVR